MLEAGVVDVSRQRECGLVTEHSCGCRHLLPSNFERMLRGKCAVNVFVFNNYMMQQLVFVILKSQMSSQSVVQCQLWHV
jgi:hypothetical protein